MSVKANKKAEKLVNSAVSVFADSIATVMKANEILGSSIEATQKKIEVVNNGIDMLRKQKASYIADIEQKEAQIISNNELIGKLSHFSN
jgi:hypothetical protein